MYLRKKKNLQNVEHSGNKNDQCIFFSSFWSLNLRQECADNYSSVRNEVPKDTPKMGQRRKFNYSNEMWKTVIVVMKI